VYNNNDDLIKKKNSVVYFYLYSKMIIALLIITRLINLINIFLFQKFVIILLKRIKFKK